MGGRSPAGAGDTAFSGAAGEDSDLGREVFPATAAADVVVLETGVNGTQTSSKGREGGRGDAGESATMLGEFGSTAVGIEASSGGWLLLSSTDSDSSFASDPSMWSSGTTG